MKKAEILKKIEKLLENQVEWDEIQIIKNDNKIDVDIIVY